MSLEIIFKKYITFSSLYNEEKNDLLLASLTNSLIYVFKSDLSALFEKNSPGGSTKISGFLFSGRAIEDRSFISWLDEDKKALIDAMNNKKLNHKIYIAKIILDIIKGWLDHNMLASKICLNILDIKGFLDLYVENIRQLLEDKVRLAKLNNILKDSIITEYTNTETIQTDTRT